MSERLFKVLNEDGTPCHGGSGSWYLPQNRQPGKWMPPIEGELVPCENGYHLCRKQDVVYWLGPVIWEADYRGERLNGDDKIVVREAQLLHKLCTWNERTARLFACDCAERVLPVYEKEYPGDHRLRLCVETTRQFTNGQATEKELIAAGELAKTARDATWADRNVSWTIWKEGRTARDANWATGDVDREAADAAWAAEKVAWAAWNAARAVSNTTRITRNTVGIARATARVAIAAVGAARAAERQWQTQTLFARLDGNMA